MARHERPFRGASDEWLTPPHIVAALGPFDFDPCAPADRPWPTARFHYSKEDDGLTQQWSGRVWCNPPYGPQTGKWLERMADHGNGIALIFARTETTAFHAFVWERADAALFIRGRVCFHDLTGKVSQNSAGAGSVLVAYGANNVGILLKSGIAGKFVRLGGAQSSSPASPAESRNLQELVPGPRPEAREPARGDA